MGKKVSKTAQYRQHHLVCTLSVSSGPAKRLVDAILPVIRQLSFLPGKARVHAAGDEYHHTMSALDALVAEALASVSADRKDLAARQAVTPVEQTVTLQVSQEPRQWKVRCASPVALGLVQLVQEMLALEEEWAAFAWNADQAQTITRDWHEISQVAAYGRKYRAWLDLLRRLRQESRDYLQTLRQACQPPTTTQKD